MFHVKQLIIVAGLLLAGCETSKTTALPVKIIPPPAELMRDPESLVDIPSCEGAAKCRTEYYLKSRQQYADVKRQTRGLQGYIRASRGE
jgi:hypothetical protein